MQMIWCPNELLKQIMVDNIYSGLILETHMRAQITQHFMGLYMCKPIEGPI